MSVSVWTCIALVGLAWMAGWYAKPYLTSVAEDGVPLRINGWELRSLRRESTLAGWSSDVYTAEYVKGRNTYETKTHYTKVRGNILDSLEEF